MYVAKIHWLSRLGRAFTSDRCHWWWGILKGESGEAPPVADEASCFRGSGTIGGLGKGRES